MTESRDADWLRAVSNAWRTIDPAGDSRIRIRDDGLAELIVVSNLFEGKESTEREAVFWPALQELPRDVLMRMTYSLLLTPKEADQYFAGEEPGGRKRI